MSNEEKPIEEEVRQAKGLIDNSLSSEIETSNVILTSLSESERERLRIIQELVAQSDRRDYGKCQRAAAKKLGISVRSIRRLISKWHKEGIAGVVRQRRSDSGEARISKEWQEFIVKTYRDGNRNGLRMNRSQVAVRVKVRAEELG